MAFNDDEQPSVVPRPGGLFGRRLVRAEWNRKREAEFKETEFKAVLTLQGQASGKDRPGADIVTVIDVSGSMKGTKLQQLKTAMLFVIRKLSPIDRLSIVTFSSGAQRKNPLKPVTKDTQDELEKIVKDLVAGGATNISDGLKTALQIIKDRRKTDDRTPAIMLMTDGQQNAGGDARQVPLEGVPVFTFGFGKDHDIDVLTAIANPKNQANKGVYNAITDVSDATKSNLSVAFAACLGGLLTEAVRELELTIMPRPTKLSDGAVVTAKILKVNAGSYPTSGPDPSTGAFNISLGNLYDKEKRKIFVTILLPEVDRRCTILAPSARFSFVDGNNMGRVQGTAPDFGILRVPTSSEPENQEVAAEEKRLETTQTMKQARIMADNNKLEDAKDSLVDAECKLDEGVGEDEAEPPHPVIEMMKKEVQTLRSLMKDSETYKSHGRAYALASEISHNLQRAAARGDAENLLMFATPRMEAYIEQAKKFDEDPSQKLPTVDEDVEQEIIKDPLSAIAGPLSIYLNMAIQALTAIQELLQAGA